MTMVIMATGAVVGRDRLGWGKSMAALFTPRWQDSGSLRVSALTCACAWCASRPVVGRLYCSPRCSDAARKSRQRGTPWGRPPVHRPRQRVACARCGAEFLQARSRRDGDQRYCSLSCRSRAVAARVPARRETTT
jgi:hypothetical protein